MKEKGLPVSRAGGHALPYNPSHLLGVEAPASVLSACLLGYGTGPPNVEHKVDLLARADRNWSTGNVLTITYQHHHEVAGLGPLLMPPAPLSEGAPLPYYMATRRTLVQDTAKGEVITRSMVATPNGSVLWRKAMRWTECAKPFSAAAERYRYRRSITHRLVDELLVRSRRTRGHPLHISSLLCL